MNSENQVKLLIKNQIIYYVPNSLKIEDTAGVYTVQTRQSGTTTQTVPYYNGERTNKIMFELLNSSTERLFLKDLLIQENGIVDISIEYNKMTKFMLQAALVGTLSEEISNAGKITGFEFEGIITTVNRG